MPSPKKRPSRDHENETGYRFCGSCQAWKPSACFAVSGLTHDGYHPLCLMHPGCSQAASDRSEVAATEMLRRAGVHKDSPMTTKG